MPWIESTFVGCMTLTASLMQGLQQNFAALAAQDSGAPPVTFANSTLVASAGLVTDVGCAGSWQAGSGFATTGVASLGALHVGSQHGMLPPGHISGLTLLQHSADTAKGLDVLAGVARAAGDGDDLRLYAHLPNKRLDAAWSFGTAAGAVDSGTVQNETWYYVHAIKRSDAGSVDALFSTSPDSPVLPADFDQFRRVGAFLTDTSTAIRGFSARETAGGGALVEYKAAVADLSIYNASTARQVLALTVPDALPVLARISALLGYNGADGTAWIRSVDFADVTPTNGDELNVSANARGATVDKDVETDAGGQIAHRQSSTSVNLWIRTKGYHDSRRN